jgi:hypothetical protein
VSAVADTHATIEEWLEAVFSVQFVLRPYGEDLWEKLASHGHELCHLSATSDISVELSQLPLLGAITKQLLDKT